MILIIIAVAVIMAVLAWGAGYSYGCNEEREYWANLGRTPLPKKKR